ncbi:MAG: hypothetical protein WBD58_14130 [Geitlerinemataceae cyanobacterium]
MTQRLKSWESPRKQGRNSKGKGGAARARQLRKQQQQLRKKLQESQLQNKKREKLNLASSLFFWDLRVVTDFEIDRQLL